MIDTYYDTFKQNTSCFHQSIKKLQDFKHTLKDGTIMCHLFKEYPQTTTVQEAFFSPIKAKIMSLNTTFSICSVIDSKKEERSTETEELLESTENYRNLRTTSGMNLNEMEIGSMDIDLALLSPEGLQIATLNEEIYP